MIPTIHAIRGGGVLRVCPSEKFKSGLLSVSAVLPIEKETVWMTSLLLSVLRRGTVKYPSLAQINRRLDYLYGTELSIRNFYRGDCQIIGFSAELLDSAYLPDIDCLADEVLDVIAQILFCPLLDENGLLTKRYVESEKKQQCDNIRALKNNPRGYASERCRGILYEGQPCGADIYGTEEEVMAVTAEELTAHWRRLISSITPACFYVGAEDAEGLLRSLDRALQFPKAENQTKTSPLAVIPKREQVRRAEETLPVGQSQLVLGLRTGIVLTDADYYACAVYNEILGGSPISRLFMNVREKLSLCYFCSSHYNGYKGTVMIHCGLDSGHRKQAEDEILAQIRAIREGEFCDEELEAAKKSIVNIFRQMEDSPVAMESYYFGRSLAGVELSMEQTRERILGVKREDVLRVAEQICLDTVYFLEGTLEGTEESDYEDD